MAKASRERPAMILVCAACVCDSSGSFMSPDVARMVFEQKSFSSASCFKKSKKFLAEGFISGHTAIRAKEGPFKRGDSCALDHFYNHRLRPDARASQTCGNRRPTTTGEEGFRSGRNQGNT